MCNIDILGLQVQEVLEFHVSEFVILFGCLKKSFNRYFAFTIQKFWAWNLKILSSMLTLKLGLCSLEILSLNVEFGEFVILFKVTPMWIKNSQFGSFLNSNWCCRAQKSSKPFSLFFNRDKIVHSVHVKHFFYIFNV